MITRMMMTIMMMRDADDTDYEDFGDADDDGGCGDGKY